MRKRYGLWRKTEALRDVSISVAPGECYGLAGPNGAGKTTLIRLLLGLSAPDEGEVRLFGQSPEDPEVRRRVGFVPESAELPATASPRALVRRFARLRGLDQRTAVPRGIAQLERMGLSELLDRPAGKLSKGEKQRTLLALALMPEPELLVLDEPTDGLDPMGRALVRRVLREERAQGRTVFLNSHLLSETQRICTRVGFLHRGELVREEEVGSEVARDSTGTSAVVLSDPPPPGVPGIRAAPSLQGQATESAGITVLADHEDLSQLNATLDELRKRGAQIVEVRRVRQDLEASFELAVTGEPRPPPPRGDPPAALPSLPPRPLRAVKAVARVIAEIVADLRSRRIGWVALALALMLIGFFLWILHDDMIKGAAAFARSMGGGKDADSLAMAHIVGGWAATVVFWGLLPGSVVFAAFFAPQILEPRRSVLLLAQPLSRDDLATGIFAAVCLFVLAEYAFLAALLFGGMRFLGVAIDPRFLLVPLPTVIAFAALYAIALSVNYALHSGPAASAIAFGCFVFFAILGRLEAEPGSAEAFLLALLPRLMALGRQAGRLGSGLSPSPAPFLLTALFAGAFFLVALFAARRVER